MSVEHHLERAGDHLDLDRTVAAGLDSPDAAPSELELPESTTVLYGGRYELLSLVGAGSYGSVYRAGDSELEEIVAVKVLRHERLSQPGALARFRKEVRLARRVAHPNVARTFDIGRHLGDPFLTMEYIDGQPLTRFCPIGTRVADLLPIRLVLLIASQICSGLAALHAAGIIHKDLKPDNVLIAKDGRVTITDFGSASALSEAECEHTVAAPISGTPAYMAPEQVRGYGRIDTRADLYALGVILFQLLTGQLPFGGRTGVATSLARLYEAPADPHAVRPQLPPRLVALLGRCLAREPEQRFQSAEELALALAAELPPGPGIVELLKRRDASRSGLAISATVRFADTGEGARLAKAATFGPAAARGASTPAATAESRKLPVAVLLFSCAGEAVEDYLVIGLTTELIDRLSESEALRVTSSAVVRDIPTGAREPGIIGRQLMVKVVLDGSLRLTATGMQAVVRLIDVDSRLQFAVRRFERPDRNILALSTEIAQVLGTLLTVRVEKSHGELLNDPVAVDLYLRARHQYNRMNPEGSRLCVRLFEEALVRMPNEPTLLTGYATALARLWFYSGDNCAQRAIAATEQAIKAAPDSGEPYLALANIRLNEFKPVEAAAAVSRALASAPHLAESHELIGLMLSETGPLDAALNQLSHSLVLDKSVPRVRIALSRAHMLSGNSEAAFQLLRFEGCDPGFVRILASAQARLTCWMRDKERAYKLLQDPLMRLPECVYPRRRLELLLDQSELSIEESFPSHYQNPKASPRARSIGLQALVEYHCLRHEYEKALPVLRSAVELGIIDILWMEICPLMAPLSELPGYPELRATVAERALVVQRALGLDRDPAQAPPK